MTDGPQHGYDAELQQRYERYDAVAVEVDAGSNAEKKSTTADREYEYEYNDDDAANKGRSIGTAQTMTTSPKDTYSNIENDLTDNDDSNDDELPPLKLDDVRIKEHNNLFAARFSLYHGFEAIVQRNGLPGRPCMLRSICEAAHAPFTYDNGILGELAHIVMRLVRSASAQCIHTLQICISSVSLQSVHIAGSDCSACGR